MKPILLWISAVFLILVLLSIFSGLGSVLVEWFRTYSLILYAYPLQTKIITALILSLMGDILAQKIERRKKIPGERRIDKRRLAYVPLLLMTLNGFLAHFWFGLLELLMPGASFSHAASKVIIHAIIWTPFFHFLNFSGMIFFSKKSIREAFSRGILKEFGEKYAVLFGRPTRETFYSGQE